MIRTSKEINNQGAGNGKCDHLNGYKIKIPSRTIHFLPAPRENSSEISKKREKTDELKTRGP